MNHKHPGCTLKLHRLASFRIPMNYSPTALSRARFMRSCFQREIGLQLVLYSCQALSSCVSDFRCQIVSCSNSLCLLYSMLSLELAFWKQHGMSVRLLFCAAYTRLNDCFFAQPTAAWIPPAIRKPTRFPNRWLQLRCQRKVAIQPVNSDLSDYVLRLGFLGCAASTVRRWVTKHSHRIFAMHVQLCF
jgi:hypothetical protein